jgi:hypothetical protein
MICAACIRLLCLAGLGAAGSITVIAKVSVLGGFLVSGRADVTLATVDAVHQSMWPVAEILKPTPNFWPVSASALLQQQQQHLLKALG